jgi:hypothetical protein
LRGGGLVSSSLFAIKTGFTAQEPQFYRGKHEVDRRSRLVTLKYKGYCWSGCYTVAESVGQQSFNSALGMAQIMGQIIGPATGNARLVRYEEQGLTKPAIYAFLGLATLPRFRGRADGPHPRAANPLWCEDARHLASMVWPVPACDSRAKGGGTASTSKPEASPSPRFWRALGASCRAPRRRPHPRYWRRRATL